MKLALLAMFGLMGCATTHSLPAENYGITQTVTRKPIQDLPKVQGQPQAEVVYIVPEESKLTPEEFQALSKAIQEAVKGNADASACMCHQGDPLCSCLDSDATEIKFPIPR